MRGLLVALAVLAVTPAFADDLRNQIDGRHQSRAFWLHDQGWPITRPDAASKAAAQQFTTTYTAGIASRIKMGPGGRLDLFESRLGGGAEPSGPAVVGTVQNGAAMLALRWHPGE
ncbi:MAG TPA: hypothetical protein VMF58_07405 [Rhizomicrobium sp.]|nr:hypothetical protein [Rhizomicrobium sp.]